MASENRIEEERGNALRAGYLLAHPDPGDEVVISGAAGRFPDSDNIYELRDKLFKKTDLISEDSRRWTLEHEEIPRRTGKINDVKKFDSGFFDVHFKQAHTMDPMSRILLEHCYEAIVDAGVNPNQIRGTKCGVFVGSCFSESEKTWFYERLNINGFGISGSSRAMLSNRISFWLGTSGPSYTVDSACSSSLYAVEHGYKAIREGLCDSAIIGGCNLCLHPYVSLQFSRLGVLSSDGSCKAFDNSANGYCRAEAVGALFLQRARDAKRIYATIVHAKTNCDGFKEQGITYPSGLMQRRLLDDFYEELGMDPALVHYIEAHGTGTKVGDPEELNALEKVFCKNRKTPLLIGSVKSNMGHSEPASGLSSMVKVIIAMESGYIPPNIHYKTPKEGIPGLLNGNLKVIVENEKTGSLAGVNSFGFGGANCHVLLKWNEKEKINNGAPTDNIPRLVYVSGRNEEAVRYILDDIESRPVDVEFFRLLHDVHSENISGHLYRGFIVISSDRKIRDIQYYPGDERPVWFIFSGFESQWPAMGKSLLRIPVFASIIQVCAKALEGKVDLIKIISSDDPKILDNTVNASVGIVALQIGLVDILHSLGIFPDKMIGHSIGELACAYADGGLTAEQAILAAYYRGLIVAETNFGRSGMAIVGMGHQKLKIILPQELDIACHNGPDSCIIAGPIEPLKTFTSELIFKGIYTKELTTVHVPYHSRYMARAGAKLQAHLQKIIPQPKGRSSKWISTSIRDSRINSQMAHLSSAEYHMNNLLSPVLFEEACKLIPNNAITIEVAPHGILQPILRRTLHKGTTNVALTQRGHADNAQVLLTGIGKLYEVGLNPQIANIYPPIEYPVSRGTPMISPLIRWDHSDDWFITSYRMQEIIRSGERSVQIFLDSDSEWEYISGHTIDGRILFPATGYLYLVWETCSMMNGKLYSLTPVVFEGVKFNRATTIPKGGSVEFTIMIQAGSGAFEITEGGTAIVTGRVFISNDVESEEYNDLPKLEPADDHLTLKKRDIYKELRLRGYSYSGLFKGLKEVDSMGRVGRLDWNFNWVAFMDTMLQIQILQEDTRGLYVPTSIQKIVINPLNMIPEDTTAESFVIPVYAYESLQLIKAGGIEIRGLIAQQIPRRKPLGEPVLEKYLFVAHTEPYPELDLLETTRLCVHLAFENVQSVKVKVIELGEETLHPESILLSPFIAQILGDLPLVQADITVIATPNNPKAVDLGFGIVVDEKKLSTEQNCLAFIASNIVNRPEVVAQAFAAIKENAFIIAREYPSAELNLDQFNVLVDRIVDNERILLLSKKIIDPPVPRVLKISVQDEMAWIPTLKEMIKDTTINAIIVYSENEDTNGLIGFVNCIRREPDGEKVRGVYILDKNAPPFSIEHPYYAKHLEKNLALNVLKDGLWGTFRHQALPPLVTVPCRHGFINNSVRGDLSSLTFFEGPLNVRFEDGSIKENELTTIYYASINFRDVMLATGKLSTDLIVRGRLEQDSVIGYEFAGTTSDGKRVMGQTLTSAMGTFTPSSNAYLWDIPDNMTMAEAASIPIVYSTAFSALITNGQIKKGDSVLIHSGTGGVGLAAIHTALYFGATVFTTVSTKEKREYIRQLFPQIPENHIGNSRDTSFELMIKRETNGRGVDLVLNSLSEEKLQASLRCLAKGGRFLEIGKFDLSQNNPIGMEFFEDDTSFHSVMLDVLIHTEVKPHKKEELQALVQEGLDKGYAKPLKINQFDISEVEKAFRFMASGKHMGKVILKVRDENDDPPEVVTQQVFNVVPKFFSSAKNSFIITGGLGGFGLELADWLILRGARKVVLCSRNGLKTGYQALRIRLWRSYGTEVVIATDDITTEEGVKSIITKANELGPVSGIFNLAVVLKDALFENQTAEDFETSFGPKAVAAEHLDRLSRKLCPELKYFVIFSSVSCGRGNAGQTNYGMSNSVMERLCEKRVAEGLPGLAIQWGAIGEVGLVAELQEDHVELVIGGTLQQSIASCLQCLDTFLKQKHPVVASMVVAEKRAGGSGDGTILDTVVGILGLKDVKTLSMHASLAELGMDSMMAVEIKQTLERDYEVFLTAQDIRGLTVAKLADLDAKRQGGETTSIMADVLMQGLGLIFRLVADEHLANRPIVQLSTLEETSNKSQIFLIPGLEGMAVVFDNLAKNLNFPAYCLQHPYNKNLKTVQESAVVVYPVLKSYILPKSPVTIVGYSMGVIVAIELAYILQAEGLLANLVLIDGSPEYLQLLCKAFEMGETDEEIQISAIVAVINVFKPGTNLDVRKAVENVKGFPEKIECAKKFIPPETTSMYSEEYQIIVMNDIFNRLKSVINYKKSCGRKITVPTTLIRPKIQAIKDGLASDYELNKICENPVDVVFVEGNHLTILDNPSLAEIINKTHSKTTHVTGKPSSEPTLMEPLKVNPAKAH